MIEETWKIYKDTRGYYQGHLYEVSNLGNIKVDNKLTEPHIYDNGYKCICKQLVHRMVAELFIPNINNKPCIDHIDGDKLNNRVDNLRWCDYKENNNNPITVERNRQSHIGKTYSDEINKKKGRRGEESAWFGKKHTEETKNKISEARKKRLKEKNI